MARITLYLNDELLAQIDRQAKAEGISRSGLVARAVLVLLAAPKTVQYYPKIGFSKHDSA